MATTPATIRTEYPLPVYNYRVEIGGESIAFSEVSGLTIGYEVGTYKESPTTKQPGPRTFYFPGQRTATTISLMRADDLQIPTYDRREELRVHQLACSREA